MLPHTRDTFKVHDLPLFISTMSKRTLDYNTHLYVVGRIFYGFKMAAENEILTSQFWNLLNKSEAHHHRKTNHNILYSNNYVSHEAVCSLYNDIPMVS